MAGSIPAVKKGDGDTVSITGPHYNNGGMAMTEQEAKQKWCPFVRQQFIESSKTIADNRGCVSNKDKSQADWRCIASGCMAWRWRKATDNQWLENGVVMVGFHKDKDGNPLGRCGLAK